MVVGGVKILPKNGTVVQWREDKIIDTRLKLKKVKRKIECSDLPLFRKFWKRTHCCRSGIFLWVQFKKIGKIFHKCKHAEVLIFNKSQGPYKYFFFYLQYLPFTSMNTCKKENFILGPQNGFWLGQRKKQNGLCFSSFFEDIPPWRGLKKHYIKKIRPF